MRRKPCNYQFDNCKKEKGMRTWRRCAGHEVREGVCGHWRHLWRSIDGPPPSSLSSEIYSTVKVTKRKRRRTWSWAHHGQSAPLISKWETMMRWLFSQAGSASLSEWEVRSERPGQTWKPLEWGTLGLWIGKICLDLSSWTLTGFLFLVAIMFPCGLYFSQIP